MDKTKAHPHLQQTPTQVDPPPTTPTSSSEPTAATSSSSEPENPSTGSERALAAPSSGGGSSSDRAPMESPILPGLNFHHQPQETGGPLSSPSSSSFGSAWSTGTANSADDGFFQGIPSVNGTMLFQNFPHHVNPVFGGGFSPQVGLAHQSQQQHQQQQQQQQVQQRRSPVSPNQGPFQQRNAYQTVLNNSKGSSTSVPSSAWNNHQNAAWNAASNPWSGLQTGRDPRRAMGVGVGVPSPLNPISPMKKPYSGNVIAPPKFPRAGPLAPKPWVDDGAFRTDNSNSILPFQVSSSPGPFLTHLIIHHRPYIC